MRQRAGPERQVAFGPVIAANVIGFFHRIGFRGLLRSGRSLQQRDGRCGQRRRALGPGLAMRGRVADLQSADAPARFALAGFGQRDLQRAVQGREDRGTLAAVG